MCVCVCICISLCFVFSLFSFLSRFVLLLVPSCVFLLSPISFAFSPFLLSCLLCGFPSLSVSSFLSPSSSSSFPFHFFLLALSLFPVFVYLLLSFLLPPAALFLSFGCHYSLPPLPSSVPLIPSLVFSCFSSLLFILFLPSFLLFLFFSLLFSGPTVFSFVSSSPLPSSSGSSVISFLRLFLLYRQFLPFLLLSFYCLFLSLAYSSSFTPFSLALLSLSLGFVSLSVFSCSFFHFPFACFCVLELCGLVFRFFLLLFSFSIFACFYVLTVCHSFFVSLGFSLPFSHSASFRLQLIFLRRLYSSAVRLSSGGGSLSLVSTCSLSSPTPSSACCLCDLRLSSAPVSLRFLSSFPFRFLASCCCTGCLSLSFSFSCLFSGLGNAATGLPLSLVRIRLWGGVRFL